MTEYPQDIVNAADEVCRAMDIASTTTNCLPIMDAILAERVKAEKLADSMYLTGVHDARVWVRSFGYPDASDRIIEEVNKRAERTGLPKLEA